MERLEPVETEQWRLPTVNEVSPQTVPGDFSSQLRDKLKTRNLQFSEPNLGEALERDRDLDGVEFSLRGSGGTPKNAHQATDDGDTASKKQQRQSSFGKLKKAMSMDGGSVTSKSSLSSRISQQLSKLMKPSCLQPSIVGDKSVWDFAADDLCELIGMLRGGRSFKIVQRQGQPSLQLLDATESVLMTTFRQDSAPNLVETPMEIVFKGNAYQCSMRIPVAALRVLQEATEAAPSVWISCFCINIADSLQARFKSLYDGKQRLEIMKEWEAQGLNTAESLRQVLLGSMFRLYCQQKTFIGPSAYADEQYLSAGWALQESLYNDIVLKVAELPEAVGDDDEDAVVAMHKKGGKLNKTGNSIVRRRALLGTAQEVEVTKGYVHVRGNLTPDSMAAVLELLQRLYWKVQVPIEESREQALFQVLKEKGLLTPGDVTRLQRAIPAASEIDLALGTARVLRRWVQLSSSSSSAGSVAESTRSRRSERGASHKQAAREHVADANLKRVVAGPDDFEEASLERLGSDLCLQRAALRGYAAEIAVRAPLSGCKCELAQWEDRRRKGLFHRRLRVLDGSDLQVMLHQHSFQLPAQPAQPQLLTGGGVLYLGGQHAVGDSYLFWVSWDGRGGAGEPDLRAMDGRAAVVIHIASDIEGDFRGLSQPHHVRQPS